MGFTAPSRRIYRFLDRLSIACFLYKFTTESPSRQGEKAIEILYKLFVIRILKTGHGMSVSAPSYAKKTIRRGVENV
jgi:hypothetical protein